MVQKSDSIQDPDTGILIIDDSVEFARVLSRILAGGFGYRKIRMVHGLDEAYQLICSGEVEFRLLFIDYRFPDGNTGDQFLQKLRDESKLEGVLAFLITSDPSAESVKNATVAGALGVIAKPFDREQLKKQLQLAERVMNSQSGSGF